MEKTKDNHGIRKLIIALSIIIPLAVAALFGIKIEGFDLSFLPGIYASINGLTAVLLIAALVFVKRKRFNAHENMIKICMGLSVLFLLCYIAYHITSDSTMFGDLNGNSVLDPNEAALVSGGLRITYLLLLISHILLSVAVIPMVLFSYLFAWEGNYTRHKKWTRYTWPVWFYVAVSGVIVYVMISPYYQH